MDGAIAHSGVDGVDTTCCVGTMAANELLEISDLIVDFDPASLRRLPVIKDQVVQRFLTVGDRAAAHIVEQMPVQEGTLDEAYVDDLLVRVHCEMQRLSEEFQHGRRVYEVLQPLLTALAKSGVKGPYRIVDIGCGTGYVIRWLAAHARFSEDVELIGVDFNAALINESKRLAAAERLDCDFQVVNAFAMEQPATVYLSTGVVHHFRGQGLTDFFCQHDRPETQAFVHFDFQPTIFARPGAWLFHFIRMREPLSRHDGVVSARRAHSAATLLTAARQTELRSGMYSARVWNTPLPRVFHTVLGLREFALKTFQDELGIRRVRLGEVK